MSAIVFNNLKSNRSTLRSSRSRAFTDLRLDMEVDSQSNNDIIVSFDVNAIRNSVINILNTRKTQNFLVPDFGHDFHKYLFNPVSQAIGEELGINIQTTITKYEPRVQVVDILVAANIDEQQYTVTIVLFIPSLGQNLSLNPVFARDGTFFIRD